MAGKLDYYNLTEWGLSYSRSLTLHACPRKYELQAKKAIKGKVESGTFSYGHAVGQAIQSTIAGRSFNQTVLDTWLAYTFKGELSESDYVAKKGWQYAVLAAEEFHKKYHAGVYSFLDGWEVAQFEDPRTGEMIPAVELTFVVDWGEGRTYEGHIDLVLYNKRKNRYMVLELKTTGGNRVAEASYKNSNQALGYGIVIDAISNNIKASASYDVFYMVYKSKAMEIVPLLFQKTPLDRIRWLNNLALDFEAIRTYEEHGYPMYGESCFDYFRDCEFLDLCHMSDETIDRMYGSTSDEDADDKNTFSKMTNPTFMFSAEQLLERQEQLLKFIQQGKRQDNTVEAEMLLDAVQIK